jgi:hypothetical protein
VCKISAQYIHFYLGFYALQKNSFSADVYVHLAVNGLTVLLIYSKSSHGQREIEKIYGQVFYVLIYGERP